MIIINNIAINTNNDELANSLLHKIYKAKIVEKKDFISYYLNLLSYHKIKYEVHTVTYMYKFDLERKYNVSELRCV